MKSGQTMFKAGGRHEDGPRKGQIKWVRHYASTRGELKYRLKHKLVRSAMGVVEGMKKRVRVSKHRDKSKSTHRHQAR